MAETLAAHSGLSGTLALGAIGVGLRSDVFWTRDRFSVLTVSLVPQPAASSRHAGLRVGAHRAAARKRKAPTSALEANFLVSRRRVNRPEDRSPVSCQIQSSACHDLPEHDALSHLEPENRPCRRG